MRYDGHQVADFTGLPRASFSARACDINAISRRPGIFAMVATPTHYYKGAPRNILSLACRCTPDADCFCNLWDADEARFGYDLFLHRLGDKFLVSISSVGSGQHLESAVDLRDATKDRMKFRALRVPGCVQPRHPQSGRGHAYGRVPIQIVLESLAAMAAHNACAAVPDVLHFDIQDVPINGRAGGASACGMRAILLIRHVNRRCLASAPRHVRHHVPFQRRF